MPVFDQRFLDELAARSDIVDLVGSYVALTPRGSEYWGCCPFHSERTPSFHVRPDRQMYYCFGCKKGGGAVNFIMEIENLPYPDAVRFLAKRANIPVPEESRDDGAARLRARLLALNRDAARFYYEQLHAPEGEAVLAYLRERRISPRNATNFGLGAAGDAWDALLTAMLQKGYARSELIAAGLAVNGKNGRVYDKFRKRLIFPIIDVRGNVLGFGGRIIDKDDPGAKYMNTPETVIYSKRRELYGLNLAKKSKRGNILLVEGNIDVVMLHQAGFDNACASMGTALTREQLHLLSHYTKELVLCYDNDEAGKTATQKALTLLNDTDFSVRVLELPKRLVDGEYVKQDADDFIKYQGRDAFEHLLSGSGSGMDFRMAQLAARFDLATDRGRIEYVAAAADLLSGVPNAVEREVYAARAAEAAGVSTDAMKQEVASAAGKKRRKEKRKEERDSLRVVAERQPRDRSMRYADTKSAMAEQTLVSLLMYDDSVFGGEPPLGESEFSSPLLGRLFTALWAQRRQAGKISLDAMGGQFTADEISFLVSIAQDAKLQSNREKILRDCIQIIHEAARKRAVTAGGEDALLSAVQKYAKKNTKGQDGGTKDVE